MTVVPPRPRSYSLRVLNNFPNNDTHYSDTVVQNGAPARQFMRRCSDATLQSCQAYKVGLRPYMCGCDVNGALI